MLLVVVLVAPAWGGGAVCGRLNLEAQSGAALCLCSGCLAVVVVVLGSLLTVICGTARVVASLAVVRLTVVVVFIMLASRDLVLVLVPRAVVVATASVFCFLGAVFMTTAGVC